MMYSKTVPSTNNCSITSRSHARIFQLARADSHSLSAITCGWCWRRGTRHTTSSTPVGCLCVTCSHCSKNRSSHSTGKACRHETPRESNSRNNSCGVREGHERRFRKVCAWLGVFSRRPYLFDGAFEACHFCRPCFCLSIQTDVPSRCSFWPQR